MTYIGEVKIVAGGDKKVTSPGGVVRSRGTAVTAGFITVATTVVGSKINVLGVVITASDAVRVRFGSAASTISPYFHVNENNSLVLPTVENRNEAWFQTAEGEGLTAEIAGGGLITDQIAIAVITDSE